jgi:hypothetical protein
VIDISESAQDELISSRGIELVPRLTSDQTLRQLLVMDDPPPLEEIKILRPMRASVEDLFWYVK